MNLSNEVASLESVRESLTAENQMLKSTNIRLECEKAQALNRAEKAEADSEWKTHCIAELEALVSQAGTAFMHGLNNYRAKKRGRQEEVLIDPTDKPLFLTEQAAE